jgi:acetyltransferase-like isoleucine patch superfamily enzyme
MVLGPSEIGAGTRLGLNVIIGYPRRSKFQGLKTNSEPVELLDGISDGSRVGRECVLRAGSALYEGAILGDRVSTGHNVLVREDSSVGEGSTLGTGTQLDGKVSIGRDCSIQSLVYLPVLTEVGSGTFIGPNVVVTNDKYPPSKRLVGVKIGEKCVIGANSTLMASVVIGGGSVVAAGSVVTKDVPRNVVVKGVPAVLYCTREEYNERKRAYER